MSRKMVKILNAEIYYTDNNEVVIEGTKRPPFKILQSALKDSASYFYKPETEKWSITIKGVSNDE